jgi:putative RecB family exonuclease
VTTSRLTRLVRAADPRTAHRALAEAAGLFDTAADPIASRQDCAVIVPTRAAAEALRRTFETLVLGESPGSAGAGRRRTLVLPRLLTRSEWYDELHARVGGRPARLTEFEREAIFARACRQVLDEGDAPPFRLRPAIVAALLAFYDELARRRRTIDAFEREVLGELEPDLETDRGAEGLWRQTRFLAAAFRAYEAAVAQSGRVDEPLLRRLLIERPAARPLRRLVVAAADEVCEPGGLWPADYDLAARLPGLERLEIVATDRLLASGYQARLEALLPGLDEVRADSGDEVRVRVSPSGQAAPQASGAGASAAPPAPGPVLVAPVDESRALCFVCRDREEELASVARWLKADPTPRRFGVVFQRPLPYLYLARHVFASTGVRWQAADALPLAAEPYAAAVDLAIAFVASGCTRAATIELMASPHFRFVAGDREIDEDDVAALDKALRERRFLGGRAALAALAARAASAEADADLQAAAPALAAAAAAAEELAPVEEAPAASQQIASLAGFLRRHERLPRRDDPWRERHLRARAAVLAALDALAAARAAWHDEPLGAGELGRTLRRWIEGQTFAPRVGDRGIHLVDAVAARFASFDELRLVGLAETDWPPMPARPVLYPGWLLARLGWPAERDRLAAARAAFRDLLRLPSTRVSLSTFLLEDEVQAAPSVLLDELDELDLRVERREPPPPARLSVHDALAIDPVVSDALPPTAVAWLALRISRTPAEAPRFHGTAGPQPPRAYAVSHVERYLECPFRYFAGPVLGLDRRPDEDAGLPAQARGRLLHRVLHEFFARWQAAGHHRIAPEQIDEAMALFREVADTLLADLPEAERRLERARLLGTAVSPGIAERLFACEIDGSEAVVERLFEYRLHGDYAWRSGGPPIALRAHADRIDLLAGGAFRVVDYKIGRAPGFRRALQLPVYAACAVERLRERDGRDWRPREAVYLAFGERDLVRRLDARGDLDLAIEEGKARLVQAVEAIERGEFPPRPETLSICGWCAYPSVCRKDYVGDT